MPRITIEKKIKVTRSICEVKTITYDLPEQILYQGRILAYDSYHKEYTDRQNLFISAQDYLNMELSNKEETINNVSLER